jgi:hypothetical protein
MLAACARPPAGPAPRERGAWADAPAPSASAPPRPQERWDLAQLKALRPVGARARSEHLSGDFEAEVLAGAGYPRGAQPPGALVAERLFDTGKAASALYFVMVKRPTGFDPAGDDWEYLVVTEDGRVEERGKMPLCARCHAEAPHDHLFGGIR